jgi:hypothetical protein
MEVFEPFGENNITSKFCDIRQIRILYTQIINVSPLIRGINDLIGNSELSYCTSLSSWD